VYAACTQECVSGAFGAFDAAEIKDLSCCQYLGKFNSVPGHHIFNHLQQIGLFSNSLDDRDLFGGDAAVEVGLGAFNSSLPSPRSRDPSGIHAADFPWLYPGP
jgi:hypothetical protein